MEITPDQLAGQYRRAIAAWPFIHQIEADFGLPPFTLIAIGSRETNLRNIEGDFRDGRYNGFGVWQRDIQHGVPDWWFHDVEGQCRWSAEHLVGKIAATGSFAEGVRAYNGSGSAARAYRDDVLERLAWLAANFPAPPPPVQRHKEITMIIGYTANGVGLLLTSTKAIYVTAAEKDALKAAGVPEVPITSPMSDEFWLAAGAPDDVVVVAG